MAGKQLPAVDVHNRNQVPEALKGVLTYRYADSSIQSCLPPTDPGSARIAARQAATRLSYSVTRCMIILQ